MIESIMFFGGGFLVAGLLALVLISFVHHRAVRLTQRRLEDAIPVSMAEIQADKDNLRAEFAMSARRLEMSVEQLKAKATNQLGDIARKSEAINRLKAELAEKTGVTDELDAKAKSLSNKIRETEQEYAVKAAAVESTARMLAAKEAELAKAANDINDKRLATDTQRVEIAVLRTQIEQFKAQIEELQQDAQDSARRLFDERIAVSTVTKELEDKRQAVDMLRPQVAQLEREIAAASSELEIRSKRIDKLEARISEQDRLLYQRATEVGTLERELAASKEAHNQTAERLAGEKTNLEMLLATASNTIASHSARIDEFEKWVAERDHLLSQRDAEVRALQQEIAAGKDAHDATAGLLQTANNALEAHATRIDELEGWVAERDGLLGQRGAEIEALFRQIATTKDEHAAEKGSVETLLQSANDALEARAAHIGELEGVITGHDELLHRRDAEFQTLLQVMDSMKEEHKAVVDRLQTNTASLQTLLQTANTALEARATRIDELKASLAERDGLLGQRDAEIKALFQEIEILKGEHGATVERVEADRGSLEKLLQTANHTLDTRAARIEDLENWVAERDELLLRRDAEIKALFQEIAIIKQESAAAAEQLSAEIADVEGRIQTALEDRSQAQTELTALKHEAEETWRAERAENTLLRERISDIAAQVAHMAMAMDKSGSPLAAILAESGSTLPEGNLTDRIRKLQNGGSRVSSAS